MNCFFKCKLAVFPILVAAALFLPLKIYAAGLKGYVIIGQSTSVMLEGEYRGDISVGKSFTVDGGQLLFRTQVPNAVITLTSDRGDTISMVPKDNPTITLRYTHTDFGRQYPHDSGTCHSSGGHYNGGSSEINFRGNGSCYYNNSRGADWISYYGIILGVHGGANSYWDFASSITVPGIYRGSITYTIGPGKELDMGPEAVYNTDSIEVPIEVHVANVPLKVTFPPGAERAVLAPQNGWSSWIGRGVAPSRIYRDIPFTVSSQGWVRVGLQDCTYNSGGRCQISDGNGGLASLSVRMTLPEPWQGLSNTEIYHARRPGMAAGDLYFSGLSPATSRGKLTIDVSGAELDKILASPGSEWSGNITVIFETVIY